MKPYKKTSRDKGYRSSGTMRVEEDYVRLCRPIVIIPTAPDARVMYVTTHVEMPPAKKEKL